eukprot:TRINITY_DN120222_c1_g1_i1.p6 TRINITY_DN120222_c1_g1~~TRINITY_DN120222_c1_g1_i1.p6  ORF type:complete len:257 (-),score=35.87 TRINITY_DN120222_c1_g1_i1:2976-3746(-)
MRVLLNDECTSLLKDIRASATTDYELTYKREHHKNLLKVKRNSMEDRLSLPKISAATITSLTNSPPSSKTIQVKSPQIRISPTFRQKLKALKGMYYEMTPRDSSARNEEENKSGIFLTGSNETLAKLLKKRLEKRTAKEGAAEVQFRCQKVLERHNTHIEKREAILRNIRKKSAALELATVEQAERIRNFLDSEVENYTKDLRQTSSKFRRQERVLRLLGLKYSKVWEDSSLAAMANPKKVKPKYEDAKKTQEDYC